jgi:ankyrin repeat protein
LTPLLVAAEKGYETVVKLLLTTDVEINARDKNGRTPLSWAVVKAGSKHEAVVKLLLATGKVDAKDMSLYSAYKRQSSDTQGSST